jgi:hypothetical protein
MRKAGLSSGPRSDEVFIRRHPGAQKGDAANLGSLFELRREQNLYANPKRTAKSFACYTDIDAPETQMVQKISKIFYRPTAHDS